MKPIPEEYLQNPGRYFLEWVPRAMGERGDLSDKLGGVNVVAQMQLDGEQGGQWHFVVADGKVQVLAGQHESPAFTLSMAVDTWRSMRKGELNPQVAFLTGKVKIKGNMGLAMKLAPLFR